MDTIDPKLQLVEGIEEQLVLGEELIVHHLQTRKSKPALISPTIVFKDDIASEKNPKEAIHFLKAISSAWLISPQLDEDPVFLCHFGLSKPILLELDVKDPIGYNSKLDTTRASLISRYEIILITTSVS